MLTYVEPAGRGAACSAAGEVGGDAPGGPGGVNAYPAQGVRGWAALPLQADVDQPRVREGRTVSVMGVPGYVEGAERREVAQVGPVAGRIESTSSALPSAPVTLVPLLPVNIGRGSGAPAVIATR